MQLLRLTGTKSGSAILATLILVALTAGAAQSKNIASGYVFPVFPGKTGPEGKLNETPYMRLGPQAAPWLPHFISILKANRPPRFKLGTVALLFGELDRLYLAIIWRGATVQTPLLEFHSIKRVDNNRRRLNYLRSFQDWSISLAPPTGLRIFAGEAPIAVVDLSSGGSAAAGNRLRLIQMKRNTVDITPDWAGRVVDVVDLNGDGQYEIVTMDGRWAGYFDGRGAAGPHLPIVLSRSKENFVPACREYATAYRGWIERYVRYGGESRPSDYLAGRGIRDGAFSLCPDRVVRERAQNLDGN